MSTKPSSRFNLNTLSILLTLASFGLLLAMILDGRRQEEVTIPPQSTAAPSPYQFPEPTTNVVNEANPEPQRALRPLLNEEDTQTTVTMDDMARALAEHAQASSPAAPPVEDPKRYVYRWRDQSGMWHMSSNLAGVPQAYRKTMLIEEATGSADPLVQQELDDYADEKLEKMHQWQRDKKAKMSQALAQAQGSCKAYQEMKLRRKELKSKPPTCATMMILDLYEHGVDEENCLESYNKMMKELDSKVPKARKDCVDDREKARRLGAYPSKLPDID